MKELKKSRKFFIGTLIVLVAISVILVSKVQNTGIEHLVFNNAIQNVALITTKENLTNEEILKMSKDMAKLINDERLKKSLKPLVLDEKLSKVAQKKADDMVTKNYLSHVSPTYGTIYNMIKNAGIKYENAGENIASAYSIVSAHTNFMNSPMHKNAILYPKFSHVGVGIAKMSNGMYKISVMFISEKK